MSDADEGDRIAKCKRCGNGFGEPVRGEPQFSTWMCGSCHAANHTTAFTVYGKQNGDFLIVDKENAGMVAAGAQSREAINETWELIQQTNTEAVFKRRKVLNAWS